MPSISVIVITKDEAHNIGECLESALFADQCVVVDSGSVDFTMQIASEKGALVELRDDWQGFGTQKNRALKLATAHWVLSIDADERLTPALQAEIEAVLVSPQFDAYSFPRRSSFCGQVIRHSGWYPDRVTRLFRRGTAKFSDDLVHERLLVVGPVGRLQCPIEHKSYRNLEDVLNKTNTYSTAGAAGQHRRGETAGLWTSISHAGWAFLRTYLFRLGFLDGKLGFVLAISIAEGTYYRYLKLWLLNRSKDLN